MKTRSRPGGRNHQYKVTTVRSGQMHEEIITRQQRDRLNPSDVDVQIDERKREVFARPKSSRKDVCGRPRRICGLGIYVWDLLTDVVFSAGEFVPLRSDASTNTRVRRLRQAFGDSKTEQWFFVTTVMPYAVAMNADRSWRYIEALAEVNQESGDGHDT